MKIKRNLKIKTNISLREKNNSSERKNKRFFNLLKDGFRQGYEWIKNDEQ